MRPSSKPRHTDSGLTDSLTAALEQVAPAHRVLRDLILREPNNIAARLALHKRLLEDGAQATAMQLHGDDFIMALRRAGRSDVALNIVEDCLRRDANYYPAPEESLELARYAIAERRPALALRLLKHFDARHPGHPDVARAYFSSAEALGQLGRHGAAQALVDALVKQFPDDSLAAVAIALSARWPGRL
jgi:tetratricopeptide (TPR) repeat protein